MDNVVPFKAPKKKSPKEKHKGKTLCRHGYHKWKVVTENQFDVKQGKLVTVSECERCGKRKSELR
ncbi:MAG: hypothetical protein K6L76_09430 [Agarilytica sp.]